MAYQKFDEDNKAMKPLSNFPSSSLGKIQIILTDIDDTLTTDGNLTAAAYTALEDLHNAGFGVVPITGRPAGWCDHIARMWPVDGVVGENGAFYFRYDRKSRVMEQYYFLSEVERLNNAQCLKAIEARVLAEVPGAAVASDQAYRVADLAIDFCEDVPPLTDEDIAHIVAIFEEAGAIAKVSSIHINGWYGDYDKLTMSRILLENCFEMDIDRDEDRGRIVYVGDSPNDAPMFGFFPHSIGVANIKKFKGVIDAEPTYITDASDGAGFIEVAKMLLASKE